MAPASRPLRWFARVSLAAAAAVAIGASAAGWYAFSTPPVEHLPLPADLTAVASPQGREWLAGAEKTDLAQLEPWLQAQERRGFCGPATSAAVLNAALKPATAVTQTSLFDPATSAVKSEWAVSVSGMTLAQLADVLRARGLQVRTVHAETSEPAAFRDAARAALADPSTFLVINYDRRVLGQVGAGHISPVGAFHAGSDRLLVLDVASYRYPYTWVPVAKLWAAMNTHDGDAGRHRGYLLVSAR